MLRRYPGFAAVAIVTLTLGIGANTAIFSVINAVLLRPLPFEESDQLVVIRPEGLPFGAVAYTDLCDLQEHSMSFSHLGAFAGQSKYLTGGEYSERVACAVVSVDFLETLGKKSVMGRGFQQSDVQTSAGQVTILGHSLWQRSFGADVNVIGKTISLDREIYTVVGVLPPGFSYPQDVDVWLPLIPEPWQINNYDTASLNLIGRLRADTTLAQSQAELATLASRLKDQYPAFRQDWRLTTKPLHESLVGRTRPLLLMLLGAVCLVLLIACANVANLLLNLGIQRSKEMAMRQALGAGRIRLLRQLITESLVLTGLGALGGLLLAVGSIGLIDRIVPQDIMRISTIAIDTTVLCFTLAVSVAAGLLFSLAPMWQSLRLDLNESLKGSRYAQAIKYASLKPKSLMIIGETAITVVLLTGACLLIRSLVILQGMPLGFDPDNLMTARISFTGSRYATPQQQVEFTRQVMEELRVLPGVKAASAVSSLPFSMSQNAGGIEIEGREEVTPAPGDIGPYAAFRWIDSDYFQAMGMHLLRGRDLNEQDMQTKASTVVINETLARQYWADQNPIGQHIRPRSRNDWMEVVGVVDEVRHSGYDQEPMPEMYFPMKHNSKASGIWVLARTAKNPMGIAQDIRNRVRKLDATLPVDNLRTMNQRLTQSVVQPRFRTFLLGLFAFLALALATVGLYGVIAHSVTQRTKEIGIRMALGAQRLDVIGMVLRQGSILVGSGLLIGLVGAAICSRFLRSYLFGVEPVDWTTYGIVALILAATALLACFIPAPIPSVSEITCFIPARRAAKIDPMEALRYE